MREITIAVVQSSPVVERVDTNLQTMGQTIDEICRAQKVDLIVFPELATTGYECGVHFTDLAERVPGPTVNLLAQRAADYNTCLAFGMTAKTKVESVLYNAAVVIGRDGELVGQYNKVHLRGEERLAFRSGFKYPVLETDFGTMGVLIGWDLAFPEVARSLALDGAELLCVLANWEEANAAEWRSYLSSRAYENAMFVAAANRVGEDYTISFGGDSLILGPRGKVYATVEGPMEAYAVARIDLDEVRRCREELQMIQYREPITYRALVRKY
ncbi:MAG: carbon-nitrogen hydrolase family protein [Chloroflexi bacterium]|nr:carbon-nitrogen hydrolase family protein [Chloroflexota bacterium]